MRRRKSPPEKKRLSRAKDHPLVAEHPHGFRKHWPVKERNAQKGFRRTVCQKLSQVIGSTDPEDSGLTVRSIKRKIVRKWGADPLGKVIKHKLERRKKNHGAKKLRALRKSGSS